MSKLTDEQFWLANAVKFSLADCVLQNRPVFIETRGQTDGSILWVVSMHEWVLGKDGFWYYEPLPSSRTDKFIALTRFDSKESARAAYYSFIEAGEPHVLTFDKSMREK